MYSNDVEFINGLINIKTRGLVVYRFTLSLWRLLSLCYYAEARLDVLKLTKHMEDRTVKARWRIKGLPFHSLLLRFYRKDKSHLYRSLNSQCHDFLVYCSLMFITIFLINYIFCFNPYIPGAAALSPARSLHRSNTG
ncbi:hypothetical protein CHARACLAT_028863 [Characodon lateralis]|uniref:Uncharacterized protein n=1 Tax=Characodon lateralis TaxID=208331 RepID=A0ABU7DKR4_9TELE|nr:hypothetical protein [Characodon lateralis]